MPTVSVARMVFEKDVRPPRVLHRHCRPFARSAVTKNARVLLMLFFGVTVDTRARPPSPRLPPNQSNFVVVVVVAATIAIPVVATRHVQTLPNCDVH